MNARQLIESDVTDRLERAFDLQHLAKVGDLKKRLDREISLAATVCAQEFKRYYGRNFSSWFEDDFLDHPAMEKALDLCFELAGLMELDPDDGKLDDKTYNQVKKLAKAKLKETYGA
jgi:hypothetical protein